MSPPDRSSLRRAARTIAGALVVEDVARKALRALMEQTGARRGQLGVGADLDNPELAASAASADRGVRVTLDHGPMRADGSLASRCASSQTRLVLPLRTADEPPRELGVVCLEVDEGEGFSAAQIEAAELLAELAAASLANAASYDALVHRFDERTRELGEAVARGDDAAQRLRAQERLASLGTIVSGIAHEIKNPLNFVNNFAEISVGLTFELREELERRREGREVEPAADLDEIAADLAQNVGRILEHGRRADGIVRGMLQHARGRAGQAADVDWSGLVREFAVSAAAAQPGGSARRATLDLRLDPTAGKARVVPEEIGRVILNLVTNALDAARARRAELGDGFTGEVSVSTRGLGDHVEVRVRDNGGGIPEAIRDKLYRPFFTTKPAGEGTGLGLSLSREIVIDRHGGEISFDSEEGSHTEFVVTLPRLRAPEGDGPLV